MPNRYSPTAPSGDAGQYAFKQLSDVAKALNAPVVKDWGTISANQTFDVQIADANLVTLGANITATIKATAVPDRCTVRLFVKQDGTGSRTVTWSGVTWLSGSAPTLKTAANALDVIEFVWSQSLLSWLGVHLNPAPPATFTPGFDGIPVTVAGPNTTIAASTTTYAGFGATTNDTTESNRQIKLKFATTISFLRVLMTTNMAGGTPADLTVTLRKNGADTALALTLLSTATAGMYQAEVGTPISYAIDDLINIKFVQQSAGASGNILNWSVG